jgi:acetoacetyl-CoA synthetase
VTLPDVLWRPPARLVEDCTLTAYLRWLERTRGRRFDDYQALWRWSTTELDAFWASVWDYFDVGGRPSPRRLLTEERMPGARWCEGETINYAEHLLRQGDDASGPALIAVDEDGAAREVSWAELRRTAGALAAHLRALGVKPGDRVVGYLANTPEPVAAFLACASIGAVWSLCSPDFGTGGVLARLAQLDPKVLIATTGYRYGGRTYDRGEALDEIAAALPSLQQVILVDGPDDAVTAALPVETVPWRTASAGSSPLVFAAVPFDHPLWILFSSGTTGIPKGIVHGHGGIVLEHLKVLGIQSDVRQGDRYMLLGSTSWMVWNVLVSSLLVGATAVLVDGSPTHPDLDRVWRVADAVGATTVGVGAGLLHACAKARVRPRDELALSALRSVVSTGSPLSAAGHRWVADALGPDIWLSSQSGGTDVCSAFVGGCPLLPLRVGRIQARCLGAAVAAWDEMGKEVTGRRGELVVTRPMPSMPLYLLGDADGSRYLDTYFAMYPGVWRHGDYVEIAADGSAVIEGRSDSTLNRNGVRMGASDIYEAVESLADVHEALVVGVELGAEEYFMPLFVHLADGADPDQVRAEVIAAIRRSLSPRHVPDIIVPVPGIPHTKTGKKLELPVKRLLQGAAVEEVADPGSVDRPELLAHFGRYAPRRAA